MSNFETAAVQEGATNQAQATASAGYSLTRPVSFNFKKVKEADFFEGAEDPKRNDSAFLAKFDKIEDEKGTYYKRKSEVWNITLPEFLKDLDPAIRPAIDSVIENAIQLFCKITYVDNFEPVGDHDIET